MDELEPRALADCLRGDARAFRRLVDVYKDRVFALCVALAGRHAAEDLAQETFVRVHGAIRRFDPNGAGSLAGWILTIARRLCHDRARSAGLRLEASAIDVPSAEPGPEERLHSARLGERLLQAIAALPIEQRAALALREWDGLEYEAIATIEGVPVGTVRSRLARAREALRRALDDGEEEKHAAWR